MHIILFLFLTTNKPKVINMISIPFPNFAPVNNDFLATTVGVVLKFRSMLLPNSLKACCQKTTKRCGGCGLPNAKLWLLPHEL